MGHDHGARVVTEHVPIATGGARKVGVVMTADEWRNLADWAEDGAVCATRGQWQLLAPALDHVRTAADSVDPPATPKG